MSQNIKINAKNSKEQSFHQLVQESQEMKDLHKAIEKIAENLDMNITFSVTVSVKNKS